MAASILLDRSLEVICRLLSDDSSLSIIEGSIPRERSLSSILARSNSKNELELGKLLYNL